VYFPKFTDKNFPSKILVSGGEGSF
jgi:hypothetical protein